MSKLLCLLALGLTLAAGCARRPGDAGEHLARVERRRVASVVEASGTVEPRLQQWVTAAYPSVVEWLAPEGVRVKKGEPVFRLDTSENRRLLAEKQLTRELAVLDCKTKELELDHQEYGDRNRQAFGRGDFSVLEIQHDQLVHAVDPAELVRLDLATVNSRRALDNLRSTRAEKTPFAQKGFVSADEMATLAMELGKEEIAGKVLRLEDKLARRGGKPDEIVNAARDAALSKSALELVGVRVDTFRARRKENADELATKLATIESEIAYRKSLLAQSTATAPLDGVLVYGQMRTNGRNDEKMRVGAKIYLGSRVVRVADPASLELKLTLAHRDALAVKPGQPVVFELSAYPGKPLRASIVRIQQALSGTQIERWIYPVVPTLAATAQVLDSDPQLRLGMTCRARIETASRVAALAVPAGAVAGGRVQMADGAWRSVDTGITDLEQVEIRRGLADGEQVRLPALAAEVDSRTRRAKVRRGRLTLTAEASGQLEAVNVRDVAIRELDGQAKLLFVAKDGATVKKGETIARLEEQTFRDGLADKKLELETQEKERAVQLANSRAASEKASAELSLARQDLELARIEALLVDRGKTPRELADSKSDVALAALDLDAAGARLDVTLALAKKGHAAAQEVKDLTAKRDAARAAHALAKVKLELAIAGATRAERRKAVLRVEKARLTLELAQRRSEADSAQHELALKKVDLKLASLREQLARKASMLASATVTAPASGSLVLLEHWGNQGLAKTAIGDSIDEGVPFMQIADLGAFRVSANVAEGSIAGVGPGQAVEFWHVQSPGQRYQGRVAEVALIATEKRRFFGLFNGERGFDVVVATAASSLKFQPGMSVACEVRIRQLEEALLVPSEALSSEAGSTFLVTASGALKPVQVLAVGETETAVADGLVEGEEVLVPEEGGS